MSTTWISIRTKAKKRFKSNFQTRNKTRLCNSKIKTQELLTRTWDVQDKCENFFYYVNLCKHEHEKNMKRLWCKIMLKINAKQIEGSGRSYLYLYPSGDLAKGSFQGGFYVCIK